MTPQWDQTLQASTFLPDEWNAASAPRLYSPVCIGAYPCSGSNLRGMDPSLAGSRADARQHGRGPLRRPSGAELR